MEIREIIESGLLETYVMGVATDEEAEQVLSYQKKYAEVRTALYQIELDMENFAQLNAIEPPAGMLEKIEDHIHEIQLRENRTLRKPISIDTPDDERREKSNPYIEVESQNSHMRIHKAWRWVFAAVFVLGKIFLGFAIYYYLENRQAKEQIQELKMEIKQNQIR
ncbi:hypothetical protein ACJVDH_01220 [Pedobacter sp. AW1-32]|uniref:hypothetical protein n=1 Tax=Pedobacter sp. AW1-32 TaxID=3383026 RepID=UPI003FF05061